MEYTGLLKPYKINRPLSDMDRANQMHQKKKLDVKTSHELTVIEINSSYIEVVDKFFYWKGGMTTACSLMLVAIVSGLIYFSYISVFLRYERLSSWLSLLLFFSIFSPLIWLFTKSIRKEINYTHYPIRLNRKTRKVHVFRQDGTVLTTSWDKLFITQVPVTGRDWEFQCHVLAPDGVTILETFGLPALGYGEAGREEYKGYWEFIRRYMEEGPARVYDEIAACLPIKQQRETFKFIYHRLAYSIGPFNPFIILYYGFFYPGRWLAMRYCKIPQWPADIDAQCPVEANDLYFRDTSMNPLTIFKTNN
ncbi:DUF6708 domain-containing protein [Iodobacter sp. CM08]|uniref:DUF6708 domain-containing protein n=1 Tax=Iodobacter sp. CM08 TaxID=3085902 RepID=UPI002980C895|nr:DUF6708 domain-containing protein [Iodobacter sp. CM08]MDW5417068.1 DUF6708 domain-containing protein [Iodobacter sp. CM08]